MEQRHDRRGMGTSLEVAEENLYGCEKMLKVIAKGVERRAHLDRCYCACRREGGLAVTPY